MPNYMNPYIAQASNNITQAISALNAMKFDYLTRQARDKSVREEQERMIQAQKEGTRVTDYIPLFREYAKERKEYEPVLRGMEALAAEKPDAIFNPAFMNILGTTQQQAETALDISLAREKGEIEKGITQERIATDQAAREALAQKNYERELDLIGEEYRRKRGLAEYEARAKVAPESIGISPDYEYLQTRGGAGSKAASDLLKDEISLRTAYTRAVADEYDALRRTREQAFSELVRARDDLRLKGKKLKPYEDAYQAADEAFKSYNVKAQTRGAAARALQDQMELENVRAMRALQENAYTVDASYGGPTGFGGSYGEDVDLNAGLNTQFKVTNTANPETNPSNPESEPIDLERKQQYPWEQKPWYLEEEGEEEATVEAPRPMAVPPSGGSNYYDPYGLGVPFNE